jgi:hypothetical protein
VEPAQGQPAPRELPQLVPEQEAQLARPQALLLPELQREPKAWAQQEEP